MLLLALNLNFADGGLNIDFRCKTKGGNFDLGDYIYIVDKRVTKIIYKEDPDDEYTKKVNGLIEEAVSSKNEQEETDSVSGATSNI